MAPDRAAVARLAADDTVAHTGAHDLTPCSSPVTIRLEDLLRAAD
jgi:hypothetical protein